jgi:hypothetical protein
MTAEIIQALLNRYVAEGKQSWWSESPILADALQEYGYVMPQEHYDALRATYGDGYGVGGLQRTVISELLKEPAFGFQKLATVADLIAFLQTHRQDMAVCYQCCSEYTTFEHGDFKVASFCYPRPDGWVHDARPDREKQEYLVFPGN